MKMSFLEEIKTKIQGEVKLDEETLKIYSRDASIFEVRPQAVVFPKNVDDVKALVKFVSAQKQKDPSISLTARSAGTDMSGGPLNEGIIADFTAHFNAILGWGPNFVEIQPGVFYRDFEPESLKHGLLLPCYTASKSLNTLGGMVGNNSAGEKTLAYGQTKDWVEELNVVLSDGNEYTFTDLEQRELDQKMKLVNFEGELYRKMFQLVKDNQKLIQNAKPKTSKNSAGYLLWEIWDGIKFNLAKLITGSQGTLGMVTRIRMRLLEPKPKSALLVMFLKDIKNLGNIVADVVQHNPESFESYDDQTLHMAVRFLPGMLKKMKGNAITLGLQFLPELWMAITGGLPKLVMIAEFTGDSQEEVNEKASLLQREVESNFRIKTRICKSPAEVEKYWTIRRESFSLLREHVSGRHTAPFIDDIAVLPEKLPEFLPELNKILDQYKDKIVYTVAGHMGNGNFHIIPLMNLADESQRAIIPKLSDEVYDLVLKYGGTITAEHNDGLIRSPYLVKQFGPEIIKLFEEVKKIFDPQNIFNPGKKVGSSLKYALEHIKRS